MGSNFTKNQHRQLRWIYAISLLLVFGWILLPFWLPLVLAGIFALGIEPVLKRIGEHFKIKLKVTAWTYIATLFLFIFVPITVFVTRSVQGIQKLSEGGLSSTELFANFTDLKSRLGERIVGIEESFGIEIQSHLNSWGEALFNWLSKLALQLSSHIVQSFPQFVMSFAIFLVTLFLFLKNKSEIKKFLIECGALSFPQSLEILRITQGACAVTLIASLTTGFIQALLVGLVALFFQAGDFWIVFLATFFTSFIPAVGAGPVCFLLSLPFLIRGEYATGGILVAFAFLTGTIDNVIRPYLVSTGDSLHPFLLFLATIGGILTLGLSGLFIGPVVAIMAVRITPLLIKN